MPPPSFEPFEWKPDLQGREIIGVDEAGRGPVAGPVSIGFCSLPAQTRTSIIQGQILTQLNDSKKLSAKIRSQLETELLALSNFQKVVLVSERIIDRLGINNAIFLAICRVYQERQRLKTNPFFLVDGNYKIPKLNDYQSIVKGDSRCISIACASILAKEERDRQMKEFGKKYPGYGFETHNGYGTSFHKQAILEKGACPIHRKSYLVKFLS